MDGSSEKTFIAIIEPEGGYTLDWQYGTGSSTKAGPDWQQKLYEAYLADSDTALLTLGIAPPEPGFSESVAYLHQVAATFVRCLTRNPDLEILREKAQAILEDEEREKLLNEAPFLNGSEWLDGSWLDCAWNRLNRAYAREIQRHQGNVTEYFTAKNPEIHFAGKVYFHLVESQREEYPFAFLATYAVAPAVTGKAKHLPLKNALLEYGKDSKKLLELLSTVDKAARRSPFVAELLENGEIFHPIGLQADEAYTFLKEAPLYEEAGILCRIPNWWRTKADSVKLAVNIGTKAPSMVGMEALLDFDVRLSLGGETITPEELQRLIAESEGLAFIKGKWVEVDRARLQETLAAYEQARRLAQKGDISMRDALRLGFAPSRALQIRENACEVEMSNGEWLATVLSQLKKPEAIAAVDCGAGFQAVLREYQQKGLGWLHLMKQLGLGACLADDMGLGKTVQVIALLNHFQTQRAERVLIVVPASLLGNWTAEIARFAPRLSYHVIHPQEDKETAPCAAPSGHLDGGIYITTYGMLVRTEWLREIEWDTLVLDEAQAIKNPGTKQTRTVKQLKARSRIAMTGTPVENRLADLWSIFDFLNRGLLGSAKEFTAFTKNLKESGDGYARLKQVVAPFILRRLKTDRSIITDLPGKIVMKTYATLAKKQAALYSQFVADLQTRLETAEGIARKGLVLTALLKLKQICNHPDQYLGQEVYAAAESGKYDRLREICETIYQKRERVLVFTQFKEVTAPLAAFLETVFHHQGLVLHGETPVAQRKEIVARFQGREYAPFMVLSIKAGGVGLNLTAANHVIHFDRWWNPAVENQATDRAFRIGQQKKVIVHKFITQGTVEEKIDRMIEAKTEMAQEIMAGSNEGWITELDNRRLMELFKLEIS